MRFGAFTPQGWRLDLVGLETKEHWPTILSVAKTIEEVGYESVWVYDHFHTVRETRDPDAEGRPGVGTTIDSGKSLYGVA